MTLIPLQMQVNVYPPVGAFGDWVSLLSFFSAQEPLVGKPEGVTLLPFGPDAPPEIPRLAAKFPKVDLHLQASSMVWNIKWLELPTARREDVHAADKRKLAYKLLLDAAAESKIRVTRLASVATWAIADLDEPSKWLAARFFKEPLLVAPFNRPETLEIHSHKVFSFGHFTVNSWARLKTETLLHPDSSFVGSRVITFASDLNTPASEKSEFTLDDGTKFFADTWDQHIEVRRLYLGELR